MVENVPKQLSATKIGMVQATGPKTLLPNETATATDANISSRGTTAKQAKLTNTQMIVTIGIAIQIARGRFLVKKKECGKA